MLEIKEVLYRYQKGISIKKITTSLGIARNTVRDLIRRAQEFGFKRDEACLDSIDPIAAQLKDSKKKQGLDHKAVQSLLALHHEQLSLWWEEPHMTATQMARLLAESYQIQVSERSMRRYVAEFFKKKSPATTVHLETFPGQEAQVDFGSVGFMYDPLKNKYRKTYVFVMTLSYSRHRFVRFVFGQDTKTWIDCHIRAFEFFGGVPNCIILDNLKAGIITPNIYDPTINKSYSELEQHYGFIADPAKVRTPQHKGRVERSMPLIRQQILAGRTFKNIEESNTYALHWCKHEIAQTITRTTGHTPWELFTNKEKALLKALPASVYECPIWQEAKVHRDCHVVFEGSFYSAPCAYVGQVIWLKATQRLVEFYLKEKQIKAHPRSQQKGQWITDQQDYPEAARRFLEFDKETCLQEAQALGQHVHLFLKEILNNNPSKIAQRKAQAVLRLCQEFDKKQVEEACQRCLQFENTQYQSLKRILTKGIIDDFIDEENKPILTSPALAYLRKAHEFSSIH